ncbi:MAG: TolC family protein [Acidobacteriota bacterium]
MRATTWKLSLVIVLPLLLTSPATAQEERGLTLDIEAAVRYGLENHKGIAADREQIRAATGRLRQAGLKANPMIESSGLASFTDTGMQNGVVGVTLPLEPGRRERRIQLAERELELKRQEVADRERMLAAEIRLKFAEVLETRENLALSQQIVDFNRELQRLVGARVAEGISAQIEANMQLIELRRSEARVNSLEGRLAGLSEELKGLLGLPESTRLTIDGALPSLPPAAEEANAPTTLPANSGPATNWLAEGLRNRPDLRAAIAGEEVGEAMIAMARAEGRFDLSVFAELGWQRWRFPQMGQYPPAGIATPVELEPNPPNLPLEQPLSPFDGGRATAIAHPPTPTTPNQLYPIGMTNGMIRGGVNITLPVRNRNQGNIEAAVAMRSEARLRREFIQSIIYREVRAAIEKINGATRVLQTFNNQLVESQEKNYRIVQASFELGHARLTDLLAEQRRLSELRMELTMARRELLVARIELARAVSARTGGANAAQAGHEGRLSN